jgi:hypothetical protein
LRPRLLYRGKCAWQIGGTVNEIGAHFNAQQPSRCFGFDDSSDGSALLRRRKTSSQAPSKHCDPRSTGDEFADKLETLCSQIGRHDGKAGEIPPRSRKTGDQPRAYGIRNSSHDNGDRGRRPLDDTHRRRLSRDDYIDLQTHKLVGLPFEQREVLVGPTILDEQIVTVPVAQLTQTLNERFVPCSLTCPQA